MRTIKEALEDGSISLEDEIDYPDMTEEEYKEEIERLNKELQDTKEHLGEFLHEQEEENERLKKLIIALWHNDNARFLNKEQIDLLNNIVFGNDEEDLGSDKE